MLAVPQAIFAQTGAKLTLRALQIEDFPSISGYVDARGADGELIAGLQAEDFVVLEDGAPRSLDRLRLLESGWRLAVAINPAEAFAIRDAQGLNRFDYVSTALEGWAGTLPEETEGRLSLLTPEGVVVPFVEAADWLDVLADYAPDTSTLSPDLQVLGAALQLASQPAEDAGMASAIWLITAMPNAVAMDGLPDLQTRAVEQRVPIYIWLVDSAARFNSDEALALQTLAESTGGRFSAFSGEETLPDPAVYFEALGSVYFFQYQSEIRNPGEHELALSMEYEAGTLSSNALSFSLDLQPPNPFLVSPPAQIQRMPSEEDPKVLTPFSQPIEIMIEFPDDFERDLIRTTLFVDGERVAENRAQPFTRFVWDLSRYASSQRVLLRVEAEDELGLVGSSVEMPVDISVLAAANGLQNRLASNLPTLTLIAALLAAGGLFVLLVLSGRLSPPSLLKRTPHAREPQPSDPLLDSPLPFADMARPPSEEVEELATPVPPVVASKPPAYLQAITPGSDDGQTIVVEDEEFLIGSDAERSHLHLAEESLEGLHTVLRRDEEGAYTLADMGTEAGTWLNYAPVTKEGARLQDGDLIHVGRVAFRFHAKKPIARLGM